MESNQSESSGPSSSAPTPPSAVTSLVLGVVSVVLSFLVLGGVIGLAGFVFGVTRKSRATTVGRWGISLSAFGIVAGIGFLTAYIIFYHNMMKQMTSGSDLAKWEGVKAPDISVTTPDGRRIQLSQLKGKRVVLDFWATWCPPCRQEIPHFIKLFGETSPDDLIIVGISDEDAPTLANFVKKEGITYPIASATNLPHPYDEIESIPSTFFIDRKGIIQTVDVGYHDFDDLKKDALAKDYEGAPKDAPAASPPLVEASHPLQPTIAWSVKIPGAEGLCVGDWDGDGSPRVLVAARSTLHVLTLGGAETSTVPLPDDFALIECGRNKEKGARLLGYSNWGRKVYVLDRMGKEVWNISSMSGVDGAHWGDLHGDGNDELVVGMNGGGGLQAYSPEGVQLWTVNMGNVWNQAIVSATATQPARVFATEAVGSVRVFDAAGNPLASLKPNGGYYAQMAACRLTDGSIEIAAINSDETVVFDESGKVRWTASAIGNHGGWRSASFTSGSIEGNGVVDWAFIDSDKNLVIATANGQRLVSLPHSQSLGSFAIASQPGKIGLLVTVGANDGAVKAYSFESR